MPESIRPVFTEGKFIKISDKVKHIVHREKKMVPPVVSRSPQTPARPIEQVLVGAWNAVKPESQGKWIMKNVYDKWFTPKYQTEEERKKASALRPKIETIVGWTAASAEAALITFVAVKGYQKLKSIDWSRFIHKRESRLSKKKKLLRVRRVGRSAAEIQFDMAMKIFNEEKRMLPDMVHSELFGEAVPSDVKERVIPNFFKHVFAKVQEPEFQRALNGASPSQQHMIMFGVLRRASDEVLENMPNLTPDFDYDAYLRVFRGWFNRAGCPGIEQFGVQWKA